MLIVEMTDMSGWQQSPKQIRVPSTSEIAIVSGRICRYAGNLPCTLLTHVMVGARVVWILLRKRTKQIQEETFAWWMLHDAHEVITGDFATHKGDEMKAWQDSIDGAVRCIYGIDAGLVDTDAIHAADLHARWLEAKYYGSEKFMKTFEEHHEYELPSPEMVSKTGGIFRMDIGLMSKCVTDENEEPDIQDPVMVYESILEAILEGRKRSALELYDGMVVELGL